MHKRYIPPKERNALRNFRVSTGGLGISLIMALAVLSLISAAQSLWYTEPIAAQENTEPATVKISDDVVASKAIAISNSINNSRIITPNLDLSSLPVERNWPVRGRLTTRFSSYHPAIDLAITHGTPIHSYASGVVVAAGYSGGFGNRIIVSHNNGFQTLYAHLNTINVGLGQNVDPSTMIGTVGSTGRSTGPHLHFQITQNGRFLNPLSVLP